jgi:hypothetical protein
MSYHRFRDAEFNCDEYPVYKGNKKSMFDDASNIMSTSDKVVDVSRANARAEEAVSRNRTHLNIYTAGDRNAVKTTETHETREVYHKCVYDVFNRLIT